MFYQFPEGTGANTHTLNYSLSAVLLICRVCQLSDMSEFSCTVLGSLFRRWQSRITLVLKSEAVYLENPYSKLF